MDVEFSGKQLAPAPAPMDGSPDAAAHRPAPSTGPTGQRVRNRWAYEKATRVLWDYCLRTKGRTPAFLDDVSTGQLDEFLGTLYTDVRKQNGDPYAKHSLVMIRYGLQMYFTKTRQQDIIKDTAFESSNMAYHTVLGNLNAQRLIKTSYIIPDFDLAAIRASTLTDCSEAVGLQNTIFLNLMLHFHLSTYGSWNLRDLRWTDFCVRTDPALGRRYVCLDRAVQTPLPESEDAEASEADIHNSEVRMYESLADPAACLVASLEKYLAKLDHSCSSFFQRPRRNRQGEEGWYEGLGVGLNTLGYKMRDISAEAGCSLIYSNQCLKVTSRVCRLRMTTTGAPCTCTGQHFFPEEDRPEVGISASAPNCDMPDEEKRDSVPSEVDVKDWIKAEPVTGVEFPSDIADNHLPVKDLEVLDQQCSISAQSDDFASLPDVDYFRSLSSPCRSESPPDRIHPPPSEAERPGINPSSPIATGQNDTRPVSLVRADAEESCPVEREASVVKDGSGVHFPLGAWKVERVWSEGNHQRRWLLRQEGGDQPALFVAGEIRCDSGSESSLERSGKSENSACPGSDVTGSRNAGRGERLGQSEASFLSAQSPADTGYGSPLTEQMHAPSKTVVDAEALQLHKDILRMRKKNMRLKRQKMELEIAKLKAEVFGNNGAR